MTFHHRPPPHLAAEHARERAALHALRQSIEATIAADLNRVDRCLAALDLLDGDPDLEPTMGDVAPCHVDEAEGDDTGRDADLEPSLGAPEVRYVSDFLVQPAPGMKPRALGDQTVWAQGGYFSLTDLEEACEDEGEDTDTESSTTDDNGIIDAASAGEQGFLAYGHDTDYALLGGSGL